MSKFKITLTATRVYNTEDFTMEEEIRVVMNDPDAFLYRADSIEVTGDKTP